MQRSGDCKHQRLHIDETILIQSYSTLQALDVRSLYRRLDSRRCFQRCKSVEVATEVEELIQPRRPLTPAVEPRGQENLGQASQPREGDQSRKKKSARKGKRKRKSGYVDKEVHSPSPLPRVLSSRLHGCVRLFASCVCKDAKPMAQ